MCYPPIDNDLCFHRRASRWYDDNPGYNPGGFIICPKPWNEIPNSTINLNFRLATNGWNGITGPYWTNLDPLEGGFKVNAEPFEIFDQWVEILPTDQLVAAEYKFKENT
ncbi:MAG: hypothetical protein WA323_18045 [Candidatus Nitrosopolaris sp.]|jgi:hypothetical protein